MSNHTSMTKGQLALARHHTYTLLSEVYLKGITPKLWPYLQALPALAQSLPAVLNEDERAAEHHHLFAFNLFPFEGIFLDPSGLLGGSITDAVTTTFQNAGYGGNSHADHIGHELSFLAFLLAAEADAWEDRLPAVAFRMQQLQKEFLDGHLLRWLLPFAFVLQHQSIPFYQSIAELTVELLYTHYVDLSAPPTLSQNPPTFALPAPPALLDNHKTSLKDIAAYLITPPHSGFYLTRDQIAHFGRTFHLPRGFGSREQLLTTLLRSASQYETLPSLLTTLHEWIEKQQKWLAACQTNYPLWQAFADVWAERMRVTTRLLAGMELQLEE